MSKENRALISWTTLKMLELLEILSSNSDNMPIGILAQRLCIKEDMLLLLLISLECKGFVVWNVQNKLYQSGKKIQEMAFQILNPDKPVTHGKNDGSRRELLEGSA